MSVIGMARRKKKKGAAAGSIDARIAAALAKQEAQKPIEDVTPKSPSSLETYGRGYGQAAVAPTEVPSQDMVIEPTVEDESPRSEFVMPDQVAGQPEVIVPKTTEILTADAMAEAIKTVESGGNYAAKGASGEYGAYQIMPGTWKEWAGDLEPTPENQDKVAKKKLGEWIKKGMTAEQIAAKWNSGSEKGWEKKVGVNKLGVAYDVPAYVNKVTGVLKKHSIDEVAPIAPVQDMQVGMPMDSVRQIQPVPMQPMPPEQGMQQYGMTRGQAGTEGATYPTPEQIAQSELIQRGRQVGEGTKEAITGRLEGIAVLSDSYPLYWTDEQVQQAEEMKAAGQWTPMENEGVIAEKMREVANNPALKVHPELLRNQDFLDKVLRTAPGVAGQAVLSVATGGALSVPDMALFIIGTSYKSNLEELIEKKGGLENVTAQDKHRLAGMAVWNAVLQTPLEQLGISKATKWFKPQMALLKKLKQYATGAITEGITEFIQQYPEAWTNLMSMNPDENKLKLLLDVVKSPKVFKQALESGAIGAILGAGTSMVTGAMKGKPNAEVTPETETTTEGDTGTEIPTISPEQQAEMDAFEAKGDEGFIGPEDAASGYASPDEGGAVQPDFQYEQPNEEDRAALRKLGLPEWYLERMRVEDAQATLREAGVTPSTKPPVTSGMTKTLKTHYTEEGWDAESVMKKAGTPLRDHITAAKEGVTAEQHKGLKQLVDEKNWNEQRERLLGAGMSEEFVETLRPEGAKIYDDQYKIDRMREAGISEEGIKAMMEAEKARDQKPTETVAPVEEPAKPEPVKKDDKTFDLGEALKEDAVQKRLDEQEANIRKQIPNMKGVQLRKLWLNKGYSQKLRDEAKARLDKLTPKEPVKKPKPKPVNLMPKAGEKEIVQPAASEAVSEPSYKVQDLNKMSLAELQAVQKNTNTSQGVKNVAKNILKKRIAKQKAKENLAKKQEQKPTPKPKVEPKAKPVVKKEVPKVEPVAKEIVPIPVFKNSMDAEKFGVELRDSKDKDATIAELNAKREAVLRKAKATDDMQAEMDLNTEAQYYREAVEFAEQPDKKGMTTIKEEAKPEPKAEPKPKKFVPVEGETVEAGNAVVVVEDEVYGPAQTHLQVLGDMPEDIDFNTAELKFKTNKGNIITRKEASDLVGKKNLQSEDLLKEEAPVAPPIKDTENYTIDEIETTLTEEYEHIDLNDVTNIREVKMSGEQYLNLTTGSDKISNMVKRHVKEATEPLTEGQAISLEVDQEGNVLNHDGRHRAWQKRDAVPVILIPSSPDVDLSKIRSLKSQKFGKTSRGTEVAVGRRRKIVTPTVEKPKVSRLPETANPEHKNFVEDVWDLTDKQRRNELKKLKQHMEIPHVAKRAEQLAEMQKQRDAKQSREGTTKSTLLKEDRKAAILEAREDGTLTPDQELDLLNRFFNPKTGKPLPHVLGAATGIAAGSKTITIEPEDLVQGAYELALYYTATGKTPKTNSAIRGLMKKYMAEDAPITAPEAAIRKGEVKVTRTGKENLIDALVAGTAEAATGVKQTTRKSTGEADIDDVRVQGSEAVEDYAKQKPGMEEQEGIESDEDFETGKIFAEQATMDTDADITYEGNNVFRINSGAHAGTTFNVNMSDKKIVLSDVSKAAEAHMTKREEEAKAKGREAMPEEKVIRRRAGKKTVVRDDRTKAMDEWNEKQRLIREQEQKEIDKATTEEVKPDAVKVEEELEEDVDDPNAPTTDGITELYSGVPITPEMRSWLKTQWKKLAKLFQIQASIDQVGEEGIAQAVVANHSNTQAHTERELREARNIEDLTRKLMPNATRKELTDVVVAYENKDYMASLPLETQRKYEPIVHWLDQYFKVQRQRLLDKTGQDLDYVRDGLERAKKKLLAIEGDLTLSEKVKDKRIDAAVKEIELYKQMRYAPIPVALLEYQLGKIKRKMKGKKRQQKIKNIVDFMHEMSKKRTVKSLKGLLDRANKDAVKLTITPTELVALYSSRVAKDLALHDIVLELEKAGLAMRYTKGMKVPRGFRKVSNQTYPALSKYIVKSRGRELIHNLTEVDLAGNVYDKLNSRSKIMQFFNPLIMAWNNAGQGLASGAYFGKSTLRMGKIIATANRAYREKNDLYLELKKFGLFSKPIAFRNMDILREVYKITEARTGGNAISQFGKDWWTRVKGGVKYDSKTAVGKGVKLLDEVVMGTAHGAAWAMDENMRLVTALALVEKGYSKPEAAKLAAMFHGDYASVPAGTRKMINRLFFTPTFKIVMMATNIRMYKDSLKAVSMYATGKGKNVTKMQKAMLGAFITRNALEGAMHIMLKSLGWDLEDDKWWNYGTRYVNKDTGETMVIPSPFNIGRRIVGKAAKRFGSEGTGLLSATSLWKTLQGDVAILPRLVNEVLVENRRWDGSKITNEFDRADVKLAKQAVYSLGRVIAAGGRLTQLALDEGTIESGYGQQIKERMKNLNVMEKALIEIRPWYVGPLTPEKQKTARAAKKLISQLKTEMRNAAKAGKLTKERQEKWEREFNRRMFKLLNKSYGVKEKKDRRTKFMGIKLGKPVDRRDKFK